VPREVTLVVILLWGNELYELHQLYRPYEPHELQELNELGESASRIPSLFAQI